MRKTCFGLYDFFLGIGLRVSLKEQFAQFDYLNKKTDPDSNIEGKR